MEFDMDKDKDKDSPPISPNPSPFIVTCIISSTWLMLVASLLALTLPSALLLGRFFHMMLDTLGDLCPPPDTPLLLGLGLCGISKSCGNLIRCFLLTPPPPPPLCPLCCKLLLLWLLGELIWLKYSLKLVAGLLS